MRFKPSNTRSDELKMRNTVLRSMVHSTNLKSLYFSCTSSIRESIPVAIFWLQTSMDWLCPMTGEFAFY
ncbi:hypothetical protein RHMOL_Rhmol05G0056700 [Rhododendron molle]|nr:hypothetical protein RHMOL_Rhmol05G0056700 [Rhododendron molle]